MTTNELKSLADKWLTVFRTMVVAGFVFIILSAIWPIFNIIYGAWMIIIVICGVRMKMWNDKFCNQRDKEYYEGKKQEVLKNLGFSE